MNLTLSSLKARLHRKSIRQKWKKLEKYPKKVVAVGSCAITGMPSAQRNFFNEEQRKNIEPLIEYFASFPKVLKVSEVIKVDAEVPGCPMEPSKFLEAVDGLIKELK